MITRFIKQVGEFHDTFGIKRGNVDVQLRYEIFDEELNEYLKAKTFVDKVDAIVDMLYVACGTLDLHEWGYFNRGYITDDYYTEETHLLHIEQSLYGYLFHGKEGWVYDLIDSCLDLAYINNIYDILPELFDEVHASNMSKLDDNGKPIINDGILDPNKPVGKILKGKNFFEPKLEEILKKYNKI